MKFETLNPPHLVLNVLTEELKASPDMQYAVRALPATGEVEIIRQDHTPLSMGEVERFTFLINRVDGKLSYSDNNKPDISVDDKHRIKFVREKVKEMSLKQRRALLAGVKPKTFKGTDALFLNQLVVSVIAKEMRDHAIAILQAGKHENKVALCSTDIDAVFEAGDHASEVLYAQHGYLGLIMWFDTCWYAVSPFRGGLWAMEGQGYFTSYREIESPECVSSGKLYNARDFLVWSIVERIPDDLSSNGKTSQYPPLSAFVNYDGTLKDSNT